MRTEGADRFREGEEGDRLHVLRDRKCDLGREHRGESEDQLLHIQRLPLSCNRFASVRQGGEVRSQGQDDTEDRREVLLHRYRHEEHPAYEGGQGFREDTGEHRVPGAQTQRIQGLYRSDKAAGDRFHRSEARREELHPGMSDDFGREDAGRGAQAVQEAAGRGKKAAGDGRSNAEDRDGGGGDREHRRFPDGTTAPSVRGLRSISSTNADANKG